MKAFKALLMREYWEHRGAFIKTPVIMGIITAVVLILAYLLVEKVDVDFNSGQGIDYGLSQLDSINSDHISIVTNTFLTGMEGVYHFVLFIVIFFFLLGSLFDDRKDLSILFWKSLPVSDLSTVLSKLVTALIIAPLCFWAILIASELVAMVLFSLFLLFNGANPFTLLWANTDLLGHWAAFGLGCLVQGLWALPIYGWLLLCSSWAKRRPFIWAVGVPATVFFFRGWFAAFSFSAQSFMNVAEILKAIGTIFLNSIAPYESRSDFITSSFDLGANELTQAGQIMQSMLSGLYTSQIIYGIIMAAVCAAIAIFLRRYRNTT